MMKLIIFKILILTNGILSFAVQTDYTPSEEDIQFLDELEKRCFLFFWEEADEYTGLISDRAGADGDKPFKTASIASTGFGLAGLCAAEKRGWVTHQQAYKRALKTLRFIWNDLPEKKGFFYHFVNKDDGERKGKSELSSIDTGLLLAGALTLGQHFKGTEVEQLSKRIYERVDFPWMLNDGETLVMGWRPEEGFGKARWANYNEHLVLTLLAEGSPTHPVPGIWEKWRRNKAITYGGRTFMSCPPLFTHQYSQAFIDFKNKRDAYADYFKNSVLATLAQQEFCVDLRPEYPEYSENLWGLTASAGPRGYKVWGGPPRTTGKKAIDGSVVPCAPGGSIPFAPKACISTLRNMYKQHKDRAWKYYGFVDAYNPHTYWNSSDVIGIDVGAMLLMIENYRSGLIWKNFMRNTSIRLAMYRAGFVNTDKKISEKELHYLKTLLEHTRQCISQFKNNLPPPEITLSMNRETENALYEQIIHARKNKIPVWGIKDKEIIPALSISAIAYFPKEVLRNLRILEKMGARHPDYGFFTSINSRTRIVRKNFTQKNQSRILLNLEYFLNHLSDIQNKPYNANNALYFLDIVPPDIRGETIMESVFNARE